MTKELEQVKEYIDIEEGYKYIGDFSAAPIGHSRHMSCHKCEVSWTGCWDNFMCPRCQEGDIPNNDDDPELALLPPPPKEQIND